MTHAFNSSGAGPKLPATPVGLSDVSKDYSNLTEPQEISFILQTVGTVGVATGGSH